MTVYELLNLLIQLPNGFGNYQIKINTTYSERGHNHILTLTIDQIEDKEPEILIEIE